MLKLELKPNFDNGTVREKDPIHLWSERSKNNVAWAFRAYKRFVESLSPEIQKRLAKKDHHAEAYVVVFGQTQVGKTTLLMDLIGVTNQAMPRVSTVLRGGRAIAKSATATAMEYQRSPDERWGLQADEHVAVTWYGEDAAITNALGAIRAAMECNELKVESPCVVFIPTDCFALQTDHAATVRLLDLPGDSPSNPTEQAHVHAMAKRHVPLADLILLVGRGDKLEFLQPGKLTLPGIEDWQSVPERFRIISTYSFSSDTVRDCVCQFDGEADAATYRKRLIAEIEKFARLSQHAKNPERYFPLEFGTSWSDAKQLQPKIYKKVSPLIAQLKEQLVADIQASTTPMARLGNAVNAHIVIARVKENRLAEMAQKVNKLNEEFGKRETDFNQALNAASNKKAEYCTFEERLAKLTDERLLHDAERHFKLIGNIEVGDPGKAVSSFKARIQAVKSTLKQQLLLSRPDTSNDTSWLWSAIRLDFSNEICSSHWMRSEVDRMRPSQGAIDTILNEVFARFSAHLNNYTLDTYWFTKSNDSDYKNDCQQLNECIHIAKESLTAAARQWWLNAAFAYREQCRMNLQNLREEHRILIHLSQEMGRPVVETQQEIEKLNDKRQKFEQRMNVDLEESRRFKVLLDEEYLNDLHRRWEVILTDAHSAQSFMNLLAAVQLGYGRDKLLNTIKSDLST